MERPILRVLHLERVLPLSFEIDGIRQDHLGELINEAVRNAVNPPVRLLRCPGVDDADWAGIVEVERVNGGAEGLLHISEICPQRIKTVDEKLKVGDIVPVVVKEIDDRGRLKFSIKEIAPDWFDKVK